AKAHDLAASNLAHRLAQRQKRVYQSQQVIAWEQKWNKLSSPKPYNEGVTTGGSEIVAASQSSGAQLQGATPGAPSPWPDDPQLQQSIFQIEAKANWENVFKFIAALYRIDGVVSVENLDLTGGDAKSQGMMNLRLSVSVLLQ